MSDSQRILLEPAPAHFETADEVLASILPMIEVDPDLYDFTEELLGIHDVYDGKLPLTVRHIAYRMKSEFTDSSDANPWANTISKEAYVFQRFKDLTRLGVLSAVQGVDSKVYCNGDWLPVYQLNIHS